MNEETSQSVVMSGWITTAEAAKLADYSQARIRQLAIEGQIRARKIAARLWLVHKGDLLEWKRTAKSGPKGPWKVKEVRE